MKKFAGILLMLLLLCGAALAENTYHVEEFPIEKEDESVIAGWLYVPDGAENAPAVILCHGFNGTHRNMDGYAEYLARAGTSAIRSTSAAAARRAKAPVQRRT